MHTTSARARVLLAFPSVIAAVLVAAAAAPAQTPELRADPKPLEIQLTFAENVSKEPFTGRIFVVCSKGEIRGLRTGVNWFRPEPFFAMDVKDWKPGAALDFSADSLGHPHPLAKLPKGQWWIQAVIDFDGGSPSCLGSEGNGYSKAVKIDYDPEMGGNIKLAIDQVHAARQFRETERVKLVDIESKLLSKFHNKPTQLRAGVVLPKSYDDDKERKYPVVYEIPGFGGNHFMALSPGMLSRTNLTGVETIHVMLDPGCRQGHHVFADSANNGPCGQALVEELIPHIEKEFRAVGKPSARLLTGHSSGGWSSLWLQVTYPDFFGGVWSTAPDPVDFRDFQRVDIYRDKSIFSDAEGKPRPLARRGGRPILYFQPFSDMEVVMGHGGQLQSFEAVFSPRGADGKPKPLWDRKSGAIDPEVAKAWERYDIRLVLERNWKALGPKLAGKLHVYCGGEDTFYLDGAVALLKKSLEELKSDAVVEIVPNRDHGTILEPKMRERIAREMAASLGDAQ